MQLSEFTHQFFGNLLYAGTAVHDDHLCSFLEEIYCRQCAGFGVVIDAVAFVDRLCVLIIGAGR